MQGAHLVQNVKAVLDHPADVALLHHRNIAAVGDPAQKAGGLADILLQQAVDGLLLVGLLRVLHIGEQLIIAVDDNDHAGRAAGGVLVQGIFIEGIVHQVDDAGPVFAGCGAGVGGEPVSVGGEILPMGPGTDIQVQTGQQPGDGRHDQVLAAQHLLLEEGIIPQHLVAGQEHGGDGQPGQGILDLAVGEHTAAQVLGDKGTDALAVDHHQQDGRRQHQNRRQKPLRLVQRHRHSQGDAADQQQQDDGHRIQTQFVLHGTSSCARTGGSPLPGSGAGRPVSRPVTFSGAMRSACARKGPVWAAAALRCPHTSIRMGRIIGLRLVLR